MAKGKMSSIKEAIRQEIERRKKICEGIFERDSDTYYQGKAVAYDETLSFIDSLPDEFPPYCTGVKGHPDPAGTSDLEEAAEEYTQKMLESWRFDSTGCRPPRESFIAGAEWQARQLLKGYPLPEDTVLFHKGVEEGKRLMMEDAVEGEIGYWNQRGLSIRLDQSLERLGYNKSTRVKIIIVKEDEG